MSWLVTGFRKHEVHRRGCAQPFAEHLDVQASPFLRIEHVPVAVAAFLDASGDLAGHRDLLGRAGVRVGLVVEDDRVPAKPISKGFDVPLSLRTRYSKPSRPAAVGASRPLKASRCRPSGSARSGDVDGELLQHVIIDHGRGIGFAAGEVAALDGDGRGLARLDHGRIDGVDPGSRGDAQPIEMLGRALRVRELEEADVVIAVVRQGDIGERVVVVVIRPLASRLPLAS